MKDPIPKHLESDIVYSIKCSDCGQTYVGKTERQPVRRLREHGAPKSIFENVNLLGLYQTNTDKDQNQPIHLDNTTTKLTTIGPAKKRTRIKVDPYPDPVNLRRSSRIRTKQLVTTRTTQNAVVQRNPALQQQNNQNQLKGSSTSSINNHVNQTGHQIDWDGFKVLWRETHPYKLLVKESLVIKAYEPSLNKTTHSIPLILFPEGLSQDFIANPNTD